ncbi:phosphatidate cytidylyltransferase [Rhizobium sp. CC-YZS058]|uniref:phosphatidate cytidylyltransferase n=1 Tax=Rhizobium sp. CC-YZS058 TaxID=3042153 RepID=UPI002B058384|nr:phosphatidate cytidylyltransferase [Rhizobium sp. CC-YZS058]MEA3534759.1 phosphatidate cytidylyltransferase [Rhizobium sp. CC-YZS058]
MTRELKLRIVSGLVLGAVALADTWIGGPAFAVLSAVIGLAVWYEWATMTRVAVADRAVYLLGWAVQLGVAALIILGGDAYALPLLVIATLVAAFWSRFHGRGWWLPGGVLYAGATTISLAAIRGDSDVGFVAMLYVFAVVWATDILAYFIGRAIGGPKLAPAISPGKTWSGAIGGAVSGVAAGTLVFAAFFSVDDLRIPLIALVLSVASQAGDLFESYVKRRSGVKDSGRIIPGHGGVWDRVDGLVAASFVALFIALGEALAGANGGEIGAVLLGL